MQRSNQRREAVPVGGGSIDDAFKHSNSRCDAKCHAPKRRSVLLAILLVGMVSGCRTTVVEDLHGSGDTNEAIGIEAIVEQYLHFVRSHDGDDSVRLINANYRHRAFSVSGAVSVTGLVRRVIPVLLDLYPRKWLGQSEVLWALVE